MSKPPLKYSILIEWSDEDQAYLVTLPEWANRVIMPATHGDTYNEAVQQAQEVLDLLVESTKKDGEPLPSPRIYTAISWIDPFGVCTNLPDTMLEDLDQLRYVSRPTPSIEPS